MRSRGVTRDVGGSTRCAGVSADVTRPVAMQKVGQFDPPSEWERP